jgi:hypothetical protein
MVGQTQKTMDQTEPHLPFYLHFWGTSKFLGVQSLTPHLGVQRKLTAFSPHKVVHHAVFS